MGELYNPFPKLPKNIRQIGDTDQVVRLYVEDYVNTYLKRLYPAGNQTLRVGLLLGSTENYDGTPYIFIDGAIEMEDVEVSGEKIEFSENAWKKAYRGVISEADGPGMVYLRGAVEPVESAELLEAAQPVFQWEEQAYVPESWTGRRGGGLCHIGGRILPVKGPLYLL